MTTVFITIDHYTGENSSIRKDTFVEILLHGLRLVFIHIEVNGNVCIWIVKSTENHTNLEDLFLIWNTTEYIFIADNKDITEIAIYIKYIIQPENNREKQFERLNYRNDYNLNNKTKSNNNKKDNASRYRFSIPATFF